MHLNARTYYDNCDNINCNYPSLSCYLSNLHQKGQGRRVVFIKNRVNTVAYWPHLIPSYTLLSFCIQMKLIVYTITKLE